MDVGDVAAGQHRVVLDGETSGEASATCPTPAKGTSGGGLATTGGELGLLGPVGLLTLLGGLGVCPRPPPLSCAHNGPAARRRPRLWLSDKVLAPGLSQTYGDHIAPSVPVEAGPAHSTIPVRGRHGRHRCSPPDR